MNAASSSPTRPGEAEWPDSTPIGSSRGPIGTATLLRSPSSVTSAGRGRSGRAAQSGTITVSPPRSTIALTDVVAELLPDPPGGRAAAAQRRHDQRPVVAAPLRDADEVQGELAGDGVGRLAHQHLEGHAAEREPAEPRRRALLARRARELRDVLREAVDALDGAALAAHGHAAPAQDAPAAVGQQHGEADLVGEAVAQGLRGDVAERVAVLLGDRAHAASAGRAAGRSGSGPRSGRAPPTTASGRPSRPSSTSRRGPSAGRCPAARACAAGARARGGSRSRRARSRRRARGPGGRSGRRGSASRARGRPRRRARGAAAARGWRRRRAARPPRPRRPRPAARRSGGGRPARPGSVPDSSASEGEMTSTRRSSSWTATPIPAPGRRASISAAATSPGGPLTPRTSRRAPRRRPAAGRRSCSAASPCPAARRRPPRRPGCSGRGRACP